MAEERQILLDIQANNLGQLEQALKAARAELKGLTIGTEEYNAQEKNVAKLSSTYKEVTDKTKDLTKAQGAQAGSLNDLRTRLNAARKEFDNLNVGTKEGAARAGVLTKEIQGLDKQVRVAEESTGRFQRNVGNYKQAFTEAVGGVNLFGTSLSSLFKLITGNPIVLLITALTGLYKILQQNDEIATFFTGVMKGLGIVFDQVAGFISDAVLAVVNFFKEASPLSELIKDIGTRFINFVIAPFKLVIDLLPAVASALKGNFTEALKQGGEALKDYGRSLAFMNNELSISTGLFGDAAKAGIEYAKALDDIERKQSFLNVEIAKLINQRDKLLLQTRNQTIAENERIRLSEEAERINEIILKKRQALLDQELAAQAKYRDALKKGSVERERAEFRYNDLLVQRQQFENEFIKIAEKNAARREALEAKELESFRAKQEEIRKLNAQVDIDDENRLSKKFDFTQQNAEARKNAVVNAKAVETRGVIINDDKQIASIEKVTAATQQGFELAQIFAGEDAEFQKGLAATQAIINGLLGATNVLTQKPPIPFPGNIIAATVTAGSGLATAAKISAAAGGGEFKTKGPALLLVGDNPGGVERVTVEPLSGRGQTKVMSPNLVAMAGGGSITTGQEIGIESASATQALIRKSLNRPIYTSLTEFNEANVSFVQSKNTAKLAS